MYLLVLGIQSDFQLRTQNPSAIHNVQDQKDFVQKIRRQKGRVQAESAIAAFLCDGVTYVTYVTVLQRTRSDRPTVRLSHGQTVTQSNRHTVLTAGN